MLGKRSVETWSSAHKTVVLSSSDAELTAVEKCSWDTVGIPQLAEDWWVGRKDSGKLRHVRVCLLWVQ